MHPPFQRRTAHLLAALHQAPIRLLALRSPRLVQRIVVLGDVEGEEVLGGEVPVAGGAAVRVGLGVVDLEVGEGGEGEGGVGWEGAFHCGSRRVGGGRGVQIFG